MFRLPPPMQAALSIYELNRKNIMNESQIICQVYKSCKHPDMYLYVRKAASKKEALAVVPEVLMNRFGQAEEALMLLLKPDLELARVDVQKVMSAIEEQGFYLQMPQQLQNEMREIAEKNSKLQR